MLEVREVCVWLSEEQGAGGGQRGSKDEGVAGGVVGGDRGRVDATNEYRRGCGEYLRCRKWRATHRMTESLMTESLETRQGRD